VQLICHWPPPANLTKRLRLLVRSRGTKARVQSPSIEGGTTCRAPREHATSKVRSKAKQISIDRTGGCGRFSYLLRASFWQSVRIRGAKRANGSTPPK